MADISYYLSLPYTRVLKRDDEGDVVATIAELDGCMAHGGDDSEALQNLGQAHSAWLEAAIAAGQDVPLPQVEEDLPSGKFLVRLPKSLHQRLNKLAKKDDVSLNQVMVMAATEHVTRRESRADARTHIDHVSPWRPMSPPQWTFTRAKKAPGIRYLQTIQERGAVGAVEVAAGEDDRHFPTHTGKH